MRGYLYVEICIGESYILVLCYKEIKVILCLYVWIVFVNGFECVYNKYVVILDYYVCVVILKKWVIIYYVINMSFWIEVKIFFYYCDWGNL